MKALEIERLEEIRDAAQELLTKLREDPMLRLAYSDVNFRKYVGDMTAYIEAKQTPFCELSAAEDIKVDEIFRKQRRRIFTESATLHRRQDQMHKEAARKKKKLPEQELEYRDITLQEYFGEEML